MDSTADHIADAADNAPVYQISELLFRQPHGSISLALSVGTVWGVWWLDIQIIEQGESLFLSLVDRIEKLRLEIGVREPSPVCLEREE